MTEKTKEEIKLSNLRLSDYDKLEKFFKKIDKIWQSEYGKECPEFMANCSQCKFNLIYNAFKQRIFDELLNYIKELEGDLK